MNFFGSTVSRCGVGLLGLLAPQVAPAAELDASPAAIEEFLRSARIIEIEEIDEGVTQPQRLTLTDGERTMRAVWKTVDEFAPVKNWGDGRPVEIGFRDSWRHELAAYELDRLLGLALVPPTVAREIRGTEGALQLWLDEAITETERRRRALEPPDPVAWNRRVYSVRMLRQLTHDTDYNNTGNLLVGDEFGLWAIDHSRAFKTRKSLLAAKDLKRFPAEPLERLRRLEPGELAEATGDWLTEGQREALLARRDLVVEIADRLIAERGAAAVLYSQDVQSPLPTRPR